MTATPAAEVAPQAEAGPSDGPCALDIGLERLAEALARGRAALVDGPRIPLVDDLALSFDQGPLGRLARRCRLTRSEIELLVIAASVPLDDDFASLFAEVQRGEAAHPSVATALALVGATGWHAADRRLLDEGAGLRRHRLVSVSGPPDGPHLAQRLTAPERVVRHLLGDEEVHHEVAAVRVRLVAGGTRGVETLAQTLGSGVDLVHLREAPRSSGRALAAAASEALDRTALGVDVSRIPSEHLASVLDAAIREAVLGDAVLVVGPVDAGSIDGARVLQLGHAPCPVVLHGAEPLTLDASFLRLVRMDVEPLREGDRQAIWRAVLDDRGLSHLEDLGALTPLPLPPERILQSVVEAQLVAAADERPVTSPDLVHAAAGHADARLEELAQVVRPQVRFDDLVVDRAVRVELGAVVGRIRHQDQVLGGWGMGEVIGRARGVTALFAGPSGTGKTMSAEALAGELGTDLYVVDLSTIVDKYIGETEKNLERVFTAAEARGGVLFFDEADALFGKRSEVSDAHDRFANIEVAYLLQRIERFDGIAVLATNLRANLDDAFARRLDVIITFDEPDEPARLALWRRHLPPSLPLAPDVDLELLAAAVPLTGGLIRNVCLDAAFAAAAAGTPVTMAQLVRSTARSQRMAGRLLADDVFGRWSGAAADPV